MNHPPRIKPQYHQTQVKSLRLCQGCELPVDTFALEKGKNAYCPRCGTQLYRGGNPSLSGNLAIAVTCLLLFIPSHFFNFISIRLFGVMIPATLPHGVWTLMQEGFVMLALLIFFCSFHCPTDSINLGCCRSYRGSTASIPCTQVFASLNSTP